MVAAGLATGNGVVLKPAEQSPACALAVVEAFHAAGVPHSALNLLPGEGETGAALVEHPGVHTIAFTGSGAVGLSILKTAAELQPGQRHLKRVVAEMGGKNCVIVDADADLDDVVPALAYSAFGFAGQKCSAAARALVHERVADTLLERLHGAVEALLIDQAQRFGVDVPPVIEQTAQARINGFIATARQEGARVYQPGTTPEHGYFVAPAVIDNLRRDSRVVQEEIFGPVLAVERVASIDEACALVSESPFALTGGLFSRDPATVERVSRALPVGNLYVNRHITGAMVARQPFGGNRLSGTGTKAGGPDYLLHFVEPRVVTEDTMRHGLVV
jgi:RHH-type proline utilization regulon transcriptional repressor/proline dehydrogenase/delta 1-pyrroline-5-carboxylate dehydrogenase